MKKVYLDSMVWNHLVESSAELNMLRDAVRTRRFELIGAFPVLEEILAASHKHRDKSSKMREIAFELIERRWIRELVERIGLEIIQRGQLSEQQLYLPRSDRRTIRGFTTKALEMSEIADQMHGLTSKFKDDEEVARKTVADRFGAAPGSADVRDTLHAWFEEVDVAEWCRDALSAGHLRALEQSGLEVSLETLPSLWLFVRFKLARIMLCVGGNQKISGSDLTDSRHYAAGAYFDVLVTDDRRFVETCRLIPETPFTIWSMHALTRALADM